MGTIATWAFFILWGGALIGALLHGKLTVAFNVAFQMYVVREFVIGKVEVSWGTILSAIFSCWLAFVLSCFALAIWRRRQEARQSVDLSASLASNHEVGIVTPATGTDQPFVSIGNAHLRPVSSRQFDGIGTLPPSAARTDAVAGST
jgi:hypothetical protein